MKELFKESDDFAEAFKKYYLLHPICVTARLKQVTLEWQLLKEAEFQISLEVDDFTIYL